MLSHSAVPFAMPLDDRVARVFFSSRDAANRSHIAWADVDMRRPGEPVAVSAEPALAPGERGAFDDSGTTMSCLVKSGDGHPVVYYSGWSLRVSVPFHQAIGRARAVSSEAAHFVREFAGPVLDRSPANPLYVTNPYVLQDGDRFRMWHLAASDWYDADRKTDVRYTVRYSESPDGIHWTSFGGDAIKLRGEAETAIARPSVLRVDGGYAMWYSVRGPNSPYRIGYAESPDGRVWERKDSFAGIDPGDTGWDSEMTAYPHVVEFGGNRYMFYCGNGYGREGFGVAILDQD